MSLDDIVFLLTRQQEKVFVIDLIALRPNYINEIILVIQLKN